MKRAAAVDIGTNSTRLLIADVDAGTGVLADVERRAQVTALGRGVDRTGRLSPEAIERTARVLESYGRLIRAAGAEASRAAATSAARDAANGAEFLDAASAALGFRPEIIDGGEEAALVFLGAAGRSAGSGGAVVIDIGGGSTEMVTGEGGVSVDIGSVRLSERRLPRHPAARSDLAAARREAARLLGTPEAPRRSRGIGAAGTWTSLAALHLELDAYDPERVEGAVLDRASLEALVEGLASLTLKEKEALPSLDPARAPVILGGAVVAETALRILGLDRVTITEHDLLDGICWSLLDPDAALSSGAAPDRAAADRAGGVFGPEYEK